MKFSNRIKHEFPRTLIGAIFLLSGLNGLLEVFPLQRITPESRSLIFNFKAYGLAWSLIASAEIVAGTLLIFGSMGQLGVLLLAPVTLGMLLFHTSLNPAGLWHSALLLTLELFLLAFYWKNMAHLLGWRRLSSHPLK